MRKKKPSGRYGLGETPKTKKKKTPPKKKPRRVLPFVLRADIIGAAKRFAEDAVKLAEMTEFDVTTHEQAVVTALFRSHVAMTGGFSCPYAFHGPCPITARYARAYKMEL